MLRAAASVMLAILSLAIGSFLISFGTMQWIFNLGGLGLIGLLPYAPLGVLFIFISLPIALFGFEKLPRWATDDRSSSPEVGNADEVNSSFITNKRIMGLSLVITGAAWLVLSLVTLFKYTLLTPYPCSINYCPTVYSVFLSPASLLFIGIGVLLLAAGIILLLTSRSNSPKAVQKAIGESPSRLVH